MHEMVNKRISDLSKQPDSHTNSSTFKTLMLQLGSTNKLRIICIYMLIYCYNDNIQNLNIVLLFYLPCCPHYASFFVVQLKSILFE